MGDVIGEILPLALGIAISPVPIIAAILMLLSPKPTGTSLGFLLGWVVGIIVAVTVFSLVSQTLSDDSDDPSNPTSATLKIVLGALLVLLALKQWRGRPKDGEAPQLPGWMKAVDTMTPVRATGLGFLLSALNPKNLIMAAGAGVVIGDASLDSGDAAIVIVVFTVIAAASVAIPVIANLIAAKKMAGPLDAMRTWLTRENAVVMAVLLLVIGIDVIGKGISSF